MNLKNIYILSDLHLGVPGFSESLLREKKCVRWLESIQNNAQKVIFLGDLFDFWFEYKHVVPKGYFRLFAKMAELRDNGIDIEIFTGNHDMWYRDYFEQYLGIPIRRDNLIQTWFGQTFYLHHGDGLGPGDHGYKLLKKIIRNPIIIHLFRFLHPYLGFSTANSFSKTSRNANRKHQLTDYGENEFLVQFAKSENIVRPEINYFIFGHRHMPKIVKITDTTQLIILGDWISDFSFIEISPENVFLRQFIE